MRVFGLCAGIGGLELGLSIVSEDFKPVAFVERDEYCRDILAARWPGVPLYDDVETCPIVECDVVTAGFPCQPWSLAGKRRGVEDARWIWPEIERIIGLVGPRYVFLENVPGLTSGGLGPVLRTLATLGFDAEWCMFSCAQMGAAHIRRRLFILGHSQRQGLEGCECQGLWQCSPGSAVANPDSELIHEQPEPCFEPHSANAANNWQNLDWAPGPGFDWSTVHEAWWPSIESEFRGVADGVPKRVESRRWSSRIKALGNAVSPPVAAAAWIELHRRAMWRER